MKVTTERERVVKKMDDKILLCDDCDNPTYIDIDEFKLMLRDYPNIRCPPCGTIISVKIIENMLRAFAYSSERKKFLNAFLDVKAEHGDTVDIKTQRAALKILRRRQRFMRNIARDPMRYEPFSEFVKVKSSIGFTRREERMINKTTKRLKKLKEMLYDVKVEEMCGEDKLIKRIGSEMDIDLTPQKFELLIGFKMKHMNRMYEEYKQLKTTFIGKKINNKVNQNKIDQVKTYIASM